MTPFTLPSSGFILVVGGPLAGKSACVVPYIEKAAVNLSSQVTIFEEAHQVLGKPGSVLANMIRSSLKHPVVVVTQRLAPWREDVLQGIVGRASRIICLNTQDPLIGNIVRHVLAKGDMVGHYIPSLSALVTPKTGTPFAQGVVLSRGSLPPDGFVDMFTWDTINVTEFPLAAGQ